MPADFSSKIIIYFHTLISVINKLYINSVIDLVWHCNQQIKTLTCCDVVLIGSDTGSGDVVSAVMIGGKCSEWIVNCRKFYFANRSFRLVVQLVVNKPCYWLKRITRSDDEVCSLFLIAGKCWSRIVKPCWLRSEMMKRLSTTPVAK